MISVDGEVHGPIPWPERESDLVLSLEDVAPGEHELRISLLGEVGQEVMAGVMAILVDNPLVRPESATVGEGMRMFVSPARPTMTELWDDKAIVTIDGPDGAEVELSVSLRDERDSERVRVNRRVRLPVSEVDWRKYLQTIRRDKKFEGVYDEAESTVLTASLGGIGMASLTCERGFLPLRWRFNSKRDGSKSAWLSDRTDRDRTQVEFYSADKPLKAVLFDPARAILLPPRGGLLRAVSEDSEAIALAPTNPNSLIGLGPARPEIPHRTKSVSEVMILVLAHYQWATADLPADPFALLQRQAAMEAIAREISVLICGKHWAIVESNFARTEEPSEALLESMREMVGNTTAHEAVATAIMSNLTSWQTPQELLAGFVHTHCTLVENGVDELKYPSAARFV